jgi:hypothetical protein
MCLYYSLTGVLKARPAHTSIVHLAEQNLYFMVKPTKSAEHTVTYELVSTQLFEIKTGKVKLTN